MRQRLISTTYTPKGVMCKNCKYVLPVDSRHNRYYCVNPNKKAQIFYGEHSCGKGEQK